MTNGSPPTAAGSSKNPTINSAYSPNSTFPSESAPSSVPPRPQQLYATYARENSPWLSPYAGYAPASNSIGNATRQSQYSSLSSNPYAAHILQPQMFTPQISSPAKSSPDPMSTPIPKTLPAPPRSPTPISSEPEAFKHWDEVIKKFLVRTKMTQTLHGLENDILVLNYEWEQKTIPDALKELVAGLQSILDRIAGKKKSNEEAMEVDSNPDAAPSGTINGLETERSLDERKLDYIHLANGSQPRSQSSINKSISQFLAQTRARNDASNRAEFLYTLAEKRRKLQLENGVQQNSDAEVEINSCARVDAKPIDRDKQMTYDIAKNGEGPLTKTVKAGAPVAIKNAVPDPHSSLVIGGPSLDTQPQLTRKRKFVKFEETQLDLNHDIPIQEKAKSKAKAKNKGKGKEKDEISLPKSPPEDDQDAGLSTITAEKYPGLDARLKNAEDHLALRYVPSPPRTLLARIKYLEDHIVKLEREYPPWAALHFNQPNRGWPAPPRATPVIVPPQLRSSATHSATSSPHPTTANIGPSTPAYLQSAGGPTNASSTSGATKPRKSTSSLHKAVLDRLEVKRAMDEINSRAQGS